MIIKRLYEDFFRPSKENEYGEILKAARDNGYEFHTILSFEDIVRGGRNEAKKYLIIRWDIDTGDFKLLRKIIALGNKYGARATFYFRLNTINVKLMHEIDDAGSEASYHYEQIATYCYKHRIRSREVIQSHMEEIRDLFIRQYSEFKERTGQPCLTVVSHGDYVNTKLEYPNKLLMNERVRKSCGIIREAYDPERLSLLTCRIADQIEGDSFSSKVISAINQGEPVLELLLHPRQWNSPICINLKEELTRVFKQLYMRL